MSADTVQVPRTRAGRRRFWEAHIDGWRQSGTSKAAYCRMHGLSEGSFFRWCRRLRTQEAGSPTFVPVQIADGTVAPGAVEVTLSNGRVLGIEEHTSPTWIARLIEALESPC